VTPDKWIYRIIVVVLGIAVLASLVAGYSLVVQDKQVPDFFIAIGGGALGALSGLLAPSPRQGS
jgi:hypothetical protein